MTITGHESDREETNRTKTITIGSHRSAIKRNPYKIQDFHIKIFNLNQNVLMKHTPKKNVACD